MLIDGKLIDVQVLEHAADIASYYTPRIMGAYDYYLKALGREDGSAANKEICSMLSVSPHVMHKLLARQEASKV